MDDSLSFESFYEGAKKAAHRAMKDHGRKEYDEFALHAGVAVERLAKAVLVSKNPLYIAEMRGSAEMLFHLGGHRTASKVRTIGAMEAIARLRMLDLLKADRQLDLLIDLRNGVAHTTGGDQAKSLMPTFAGTVETLHEDLGGPLNRFWGNWTTVARLTVDTKRSEVYREVQIRLRHARHAFQDRVGALPQHVREAIAQAPYPVEGEVVGPLDLDENRQTILRLAGAKCPACDGRASVFYSPLSSSMDRVLMVPDCLKCMLCGLELNTPDEIAASGTRVQALTLPGLRRIFGESDSDGMTMGETHAG